MAVLTHEAVVAALVARGVPEHVANGVAMNFRDESGFNTGIQEAAPISGRGGYGLAQWTGPRRIALEDYAKAKGTTPDDPNAQFDFFMQENAGPEAAAWKRVMSAPDANTAAMNFVNYWERPTTKNAAARTAKYAGSTGAHPPNPSVGAGGYVKPGADTTTVAQAAKPKTAKQTFGEGIGKALEGGLAGMAGAGAPQGGWQPNIPQMPTHAPTPMPAMATAISPFEGQGRDQLAALMQRLNAGTLWG